MHLVDRKILIDLINDSSKNQLKEVDQLDNIMELYQNFLKTYEFELVKTHKTRIQSRTDDIVEITYKLLKNHWLKKHCPPISYIGEGSSRAAYACNGGKCFKIAIKTKGIAQNRQEIKNVGVGINKKYSCFSTNYAYDHKTYGSILTECCSTLKESDLQQLYGIIGGGEELYEVFLVLKQNEFNLKQAYIEQAQKLREIKFAKRHNNDSYDMYDEKAIERLVNILKNMLSNKGLEWKVLRDLNQFYVDNHKSDAKLLIQDLGNIDNWGLAIRKNKLVPVLLDSGFSEQIYQDYYNIG